LLVAAGLCASPALAQAIDDALTPSIAPPIELLLPLGLEREALAPAGDIEDGARVVLSLHVLAPAGSPWMRLNLAGTQLSGEPGAEGARLRITSVLDGSSQLLSAESLAQAGFASVYLNGNTARIELLMWAHSDEAWQRSTLRVPSLWHGEPASFATNSICDSVDDRVLSSERRSGRLSNGCTGWLTDGANTPSLTAGHCGLSTTSLMSFQVPLSTSSGGSQAAAATDQYPVDFASVQGNNGGVGADWRVYATFVNSTTGLTARQAQGELYTLAPSAPAVGSGAQIRITGYGSVSSPVSPTWNGVQKTHSGAYSSASSTTLRYRPDTTGGNSGSAVLHEPTGRAIGIHTHGGCGTSGAGSNVGTNIGLAPLQAALGAPLGVLASGIGAAETAMAQRVLVLGDDVNNLGRLSTTTGAFGRTHVVGARWQSLTWDPLRSRALAINEARQLHTLNATTGEAVLLGTISGTSLTFTGLALDPSTDTLFGVTNSNGQLWTINPSSLVATPRGSASAYRYTALEYDVASGQLFAIDMNSVAGPRLVRINPTSAASVLVGALGNTSALVQGLAIDHTTGTLLCINAATDQTLTISRTTGVASVLGASGGSFGARLGMTSIYELCPDLDFNNDGLFPDDTDLLALLAVLGGGECGACDNIDINRDGLFPDDADLLAFLGALAGGC
jgi:V8-like Glu-specific endopeptidase